MRTIAAVFALLLAGAATALAAGTTAATPPPVRRMDLAVTLEPLAGTLAGTARLSLGRGDRAPRTVTLARSFSLLPGAEETEVEAVDEGPRRDGLRTWRIVARRGREIVLRWSGRPDALSASLAAFAPADGWYPATPATAPEFALTVTLPAAWRALSPGRLVSSPAPEGGRRVERFEGSLPPDGLSLVAAAWTAVSERRSGGARLAVYALAAGVDAQEVLDDVEAGLERSTSAFGPHAWQGYAVAEWPAAARGIPPIPAVARLVPAELRDPLARRARLRSEILSDWWGRGVFVDPGGSDWSVGLAACLDAAPHGDGTDGSTAFRRGLLREIAQEPTVPGPLAAPAGAERGPSAARAFDARTTMIFCMLRRQIGEAAFNAALRTLYATFRQRRAGWADLRAAFETAAGPPAAAFFATWVESAALPSIRLADLPVIGRRRGGETLLEVRVVSDPLLDIDVPVQVDTQGSAGARRVTTVARPGVPVLVRVQGTVERGRVALDPGAEVLRRLAPGEITLRIADILEEPPDLVLVGTRRGAALETAARAAAASLAPGRPVRRDTDVRESDLRAARRLLVLGAPDAASALGRALPPRLPAGVLLGEGALRAAGAVAEDTAAAAAIAFPFPAEGEGRVVLVDALGPSGMAAAARHLSRETDTAEVLFSAGGVVARSAAREASETVADFGEIQ